MAIDPNELAGLKESFYQVTGQHWSSFYCPVLNEYGEGTGLMNGHILPRCVKSASRETVIQRRDVDNPFGKIEDGLCAFLNLPYLEMKEIYGIYERPRGLIVSGSDSTLAPAFFASPKSAPKVPLIELSTEGELVATPHIRIDPDKLEAFRGEVEVEGEIVFSVPALTVSLIKASHLTLFKLMGYRWVYHPAGQFIGSSLARVVRNQVSQESQKAVFEQFPKCFHLLPEGQIQETTLDHGLILLHFDPHQGNEHPLEQLIDCWGLSTLLRMNNHMWVVTLPYTCFGRSIEECMDSQKKWFAEDSSKHTAFCAWISKCGEIQHTKMSFNLSRQPRLRPALRFTGVVAGAVLRLVVTS